MKRGRPEDGYGMDQGPGKRMPPGPGMPAGHPQMTPQGYPAGFPGHPQPGFPAAGVVYPGQQMEQHPNSNNNNTLKKKDAEDYLNQVKEEFDGNPDVYQTFLGIMRNFQKKTMDTEGVIKEVSTLFAGHDNLILNFNQFLPPGYQIECERRTQAAQQQQGVPMMQQQQGYPAPGVQLPPMDMNAMHYQQQMMARGGPEAQGAPGRGPPAAPVQMPVPTQPGVPPAPGMVNVQNKDEYDHAITYVKKIRDRFESPEDTTYKEFLKILHAFKEEKRDIEVVYQEVETLFADHPDLLNEFTQFLPDFIPQAEARQRQQAEAAAKAAKAGKKKASAAAPAKSDPKDKAKAAGKGSKDVKTKASKDDVPLKKKERIPLSKEAQFFEKVRQRLQNRDAHMEFVKCVQLYNHDVISKNELLTLVDDIFGRNGGDLMDGLRVLLKIKPQGKDAGMDKRQRTPCVLRGPLSEVDFSTCKRNGPSYRKLPKYVTIPEGQGRSELCQEVLNDVWVSVPTGSEDFSFKHMRKNQYEESMFICEDDRFEVDVIIESNLSTMRFLEPIAQSIQELRSEEKQRFKLQPLGPIQSKAICRVYGDKGLELLDALRRNPVVGVPVVLARLKQKDEEWRAARREMNKQWKEVHEQNYQKSLDHRSFYFKQQDKKLLTQRQMVQEIKDAAEEKEATTYPLKLNFPNAEVNKEVFRMIDYGIEKTIPQREKDKCRAFVNSFIRPFLNIDAPAEFNEQLAEKKRLAREKTNQCKPVSHAAADGENTNGNKAPIEHDFNTLFIGNTTFYLFFRLYTYLYQRLAKARELAAANMPGSAEKNAEEAQATYNKFIDAVMEVIDGNMEISKFEDECRLHMGATSYLLFTLDKLINSLVRQIAAINSDEQCQKLLSLHVHELARPRTAEDSLYQASALEAMGGDEDCYQFETKEPHHIHVRLVTASSLKHVARRLQEKWEEYAINYVEVGAEASNRADASDSSLFRRRHVEKKDFKKAYENTTFTNGLESKICTTAFKMNYVERSEDFFYRKGSLKRAAASPRSKEGAKSTDIWRKWLEAQPKEAEPMEEDEVKVDKDEGSKGDTKDEEGSNKGDEAKGDSEDEKEKSSDERSNSDSEKKKDSGAEKSDSEDSADMDVPMSDAEKE